MKGRLMLSVIVYAILLLTSPLTTRSHAAESGALKGSWIANGSRTTFDFGDGRQVFTFKLAGHVNLQTSLSKTKDYWSECIGLADSVTGIVGRCVWKDLAGPEIYLTIQSDKLQQGSLVSGTIVGGSGHLAGISGELSFNWSSVTTLAEAEGVVSVTGQTKNLSGTYRVP